MHMHMPHPSPKPLTPFKMERMCPHHPNSLLIGLTNPSQAAFSASLLMLLATYFGFLQPEHHFPFLLLVPAPIQISGS